MYIVSACLLGENVKYNGGNNYNVTVVEFLKDKSFVPICPEVFGGLTIPREPCERLGDKVVNKVGEDVTREFFEGAKKCFETVLQKAGQEEIEGAKQPETGMTAGTVNTVAHQGEIAAFGISFCKGQCKKQNVHQPRSGEQQSDQPGHPPKIQLKGLCESGGDAKQGGQQQ
jgi:uncharacterized protein YbbK (DUF523 family)